MSTTSSRRQPSLTPTIRSSSSSLRAPSTLSDQVKADAQLYRSATPSLISNSTTTTASSLVSRASSARPATRPAPYTLPSKAALAHRRQRSMAAAAPPRQQTAYEHEWQLWKAFAAKYGYAKLPTHDSLSLYLEWRSEHVANAAELKEVVAGVEWAAAPKMEHWEWEGVKRHAAVRRVIKGKAEMEKEELAGRISAWC